MSFFFKYFLASFPLFLIFCDALLSPDYPNHPIFFCDSAAVSPAYDKLSTI